MSSSLSAVDAAAADVNDIAAAAAASDAAGKYKMMFHWRQNTWQQKNSFRKKLSSNWNVELWMKMKLLVRK